MRELVFGAMPASATPLTHIASGPWCFFQQEENFQGWDGDIWQDLPWQTLQEDQENKERKEHASPSFTELAVQEKKNSAYTSINSINGFSLPPDPFCYSEKKGTHQSIDSLAQQANGEVVRLIELLGKKLNTKFCIQYSEKFWTMALGPWLLLVTHTLAERQKRVLDLIQLFEKEPLIVPILPKECSFSFSSLQELMTLGIQNRDVNHYIFSRIIEAVAPSHWELKTLPPCDLGKKQRASSISSKKKKRHTFQCLKNTTKTRIQPYLRQLPFPRQKGFGLVESLMYSLAVVSNRNKEAHSIDFREYASTPIQWVFDAVSFIEATMPTDISKQTSMPKIPKSKGKLRGMTAAISQDDTYRLSLAAWLEGGGKLFSIQHGANYGNLRAMGGSIFEYMQHAFITWGWEHHEDYAVNAQPLEQPHMPTPELRKKVIEQKEPESLIFVGTEMSSYSYRLKSRPFATAQVNYRKSKIRFLSSLPTEVQHKTLYRPYFPVEGGLADESYVKRFLPHIALCRGDLSSQLLSCRLLVLDHYGTTLLTSLASNIPLLCFWEPSHWAMEKESAKAIDTLRRVGVIYDNAVDAANAVVKVWDNVELWWSSDAIQEARTSFIQHYARGQKKKKRFPWFKTLLSL